MSPLQNESEIQFVPHRKRITSPLKNECEIQFLPHRNHVTSPLQNESEIQFVPHRNHITSPLQNESENVTKLYLHLVGNIISMRGISFHTWGLFFCTVAYKRYNALKHVLGRQHVASRSRWLQFSNTCKDTVRETG
jgi:hypothetical protein